ncbi:hypothetical protein PR048_002455 [Dryococelus australis]|uniref:Uncharacterized protein n=1 Tax=Dryococelus australis TaxID=614101 RepID=A0ABQ9IK97_9NEOP|nr:hypothetical protein PR048_002455 [Dryococelus australis]
MQCKCSSTHHIEIKRRRDNVRTYSVKVNGSEVIVCQTFLRGLCQISEKRLRVIQCKVLNGESFPEKRGTNNNRPRSIDSNIWDLAKEHLSTIPSRENKNIDMSKLPKYKTYHTFFKAELNYGCTLPKTDLCDYCSECKVKLVVNPNDLCKVQYELHLRRYNVYKNARMT